MGPKLFAVFAFLRLLTAWGAHAAESAAERYGLPASAIRDVRDPKNISNEIEKLLHEIGDIQARYVIPGFLPEKVFNPTVEAPAKEDDAQVVTQVVTQEQFERAKVDMRRLTYLQGNLYFWKKMQTQQESRSTLQSEWASKSAAAEAKEKQRLIANADERRLAFVSELERLEELILERSASELEQLGVQTFDMQTSEELRPEVLQSQTNSKSDISAAATFGSLVLLLSIFAMVTARWLLHTQTKLTVKDGSA